MISLILVLAGFGLGFWVGFWVGSCDSEQPIEENEPLPVAKVIKLTRIK